MMLRLNQPDSGSADMLQKALLLAVPAAAAIGIAAWPGPSLLASAAVAPAVAAEVPAEPVPSARPVSRRERMARIVAEQAAISAEISARQALARKAAAGDTAMR